MRNVDWRETNGSIVHVRPTPGKIVPVSYPYKQWGESWVHRDQIKQIGRAGAFEDVRLRPGRGVAFTGCCTPDYRMRQIRKETRLRAGRSDE